MEPRITGKKVSEVEALNRPEELQRALRRKMRLIPPALAAKLARQAESVKQVQSPMKGTLR